MKSTDGWPFLKVLLDDKAWRRWETSRYSPQTAVFLEKADARLLASMDAFSIPACPAKTYLAFTPKVRTGATVSSFVECRQGREHDLLSTRWGMTHPSWCNCTVFVHIILRFIMLQPTVTRTPCSQTRLRYEASFDLRWTLMIICLGSRRSNPLDFLEKPVFNDWMFYGPLR